MSDTMTVRGALAERYREYRDLCGDFDRSLIPTYRTALLGSPAQADEQTLAFVLRGQVRFSPGANAVFRSMFDRDEAVGELDSLRPSISITDVGLEVINALKLAGRIDAIVAAFTFLFIEANPRLVEVEELGELPAEDNDADDSTDPPDEPPEGYGGES